MCLSSFYRMIKAGHKIFSTTKAGEVGRDGIGGEIALRDIAYRQEQLEGLSLAIHVDGVGEWEDVRRLHQ